MNNFQKRKNGFTIIELIVAMAIVAILVTVSYVGYTKYIKKSRESVALQESRQYALALYDYNISYISGEFNGSFVEYCEENELNTENLIPINQVVSNSQSISPQNSNNKIEGFLLLVDNNYFIFHTIIGGTKITSIDETKIDLIDKQGNETLFYTLARVESKESYLEFKELIEFIYDTFGDDIAYDFSEITKGKIKVGSPIVERSLLFDNNTNGATINGFNPTLLESLVIPIEYIDNSTIYDVINIGNDSFKNGSFKYAHIPSTIKTIGKNAFENTNLVSITIPGSVETIGEEAFANCPNIKTLNISNGVKTIKECAFKNTGNYFSNFFIPSSVETIEADAFDCSVFAFFIELGSPIRYDSNNNTGWYYDGISDSFTSYAPKVYWNSVVKDNLVYGLMSDDTYSASSIKATLTNVSILNEINNKQVTVIENFGFFDNPSLISIKIPANIKTIEMYTFYNCTNLKRVLFEENSSLTTITDGAFYSCANLESIVIPSSVETIGAAVFQDCTKLKSIVIPKNVETIDSYAFKNCTNLKSVTFENGSKLTVFSDNMFESCSNLESIVIPNSVETINKNAFYGCTSLKSIVIPDGVETINDNVFTHCTSLELITIPSSVKNMGNSVFDGCTMLKEIRVIGHNSAPTGWDPAWNQNTLANIIWNYS